MVITVHVTTPFLRGGFIWNKLFPSHFIKKNKKKDYFLYRHTPQILMVIGFLLHHFHQNHSERYIGIVVSLQGCELHLSTSFQRVKHWLKVSEQMLALMGMHWYNFACLMITYLAVMLTCGQSVLALFFDWEIYFTLEQTFLHQNLYIQYL